jgi:hypothetical protein
MSPPSPLTGEDVRKLEGLPQGDKETFVRRTPILPMTSHGQTGPERGHGSRTLEESGPETTTPAPALTYRQTYL